MKKLITNAILLSFRSLDDQYDDREREDTEYSPIGLYGHKDQVMARIKDDAEFYQVHEANSAPIHISEDSSGYVTVTFDHTDFCLEYCFEYIGNMEVCY